CDRRAAGCPARLGEELEAARPQPACDVARGGVAVRHEEAFKRLPDLLDDRDDPELLGHVHACADCQRQLFLLGRVDRMLRDSASAHRAARRRWPTARQLLAAAAVIAAAAAATLALVVPQNAHTHELILKTASGRSVAQAVMGR